MKSCLTVNPQAAADPRDNSSFSPGPRLSSITEELWTPEFTGRLHRVARGFLRKERVDHTLQPTALVNEAFLKLADQNRATWSSSEHVFSFAVTAMRRILLDHARNHGAFKRGSSWKREPMENLAAFSDLGERHDIVELRQLLEKLAGRCVMSATVLEQRLFLGYSVSEVAADLDISEPTVKRYLKKGKAFFVLHLSRASQAAN